MIRKGKGLIEWLEFEILSEIPGLAHGVFLRHGGASHKEFASLNFLHKGDEELANIKQNRLLISEIVQLRDLVSAHQIHGKELFHLDLPPKEAIYGDGLITSKKSLGLMALHADCQAALFYDPIHHAVATVHAGWRGQRADIYEEMVQKMKGLFGTKPEDLLVGISPSLGPLNSEFIHYKEELPEAFWDFQVQATYFDLWSIAEWQLVKAGVLPHHIEIARIDTYAHPEDFFSYRRETKMGKKTGGHASVIALI